MLDPFLTFINQHKLDLKKQPCLLTVSGGVDSVVMLHLFQKAGFPAGIAHCNFGLRGDESEGDEQFVKELAKTYDFPFFSKRFDVKSFAKKRGISTQMAARELRYEWFEQLRAAHNYAYIATAHHANDSLETVLLNLTRGTGLSGLYGISGINSYLLRPLILATKEQILAYAQANGLHWREDQSNDSDDYKRNLIRHKVVPVLQQLNPSLEATFIHSADKLQSADQLLRELLDEWSIRAVIKKNDQIRIHIALLLAEGQAAYRLWHLLDQFGFSYRQSVQIIASLPGIPGRQFLSDSHILLIDREELIVQKKFEGLESSTWAIHVPNGELQLGGFILRLSQKDRDSLPRNAYDSQTVILNSQKLEFPLTVRKWQTGDVFQPFGMNGRKKKLSDFFTDLKMDLFTKQSTFILVNGNQEIIWVIGLRLDERYRVNPDTTGFLEVTWTVCE
ncbi:tRNA lysidine(34) synthetase TilS [Dyadobacter chenwenxiniae]|uniref:tRNA(Ile)-lysidine synthase n=1 Tax=Dyadobacter chenwenxiniae TaxID=2906456 RepID=A0A9X1PHY8_9BACT|nr:tRNA lysidine(34) synthetase TilS [Dyadobacter chenwenxiniae]MCF0060665.1 tRNA lysidine(34) synthetase TilS [Dyadobacter chenwenxiniae]UON80499.1 tRNA lysidine(34) synthetase TilS [Dyadobacter chenwenxiniae]